MDPARAFGLSHLPKLIDPAQAAFRDDVLTRLANEEITRGVMYDIMPMVTSRDPGNSFVWITSKTAPLSTPMVRGILEGTNSRVPLEQALAGGWSLFLHAPTSAFGEDAARLIVAVFLHRLWAAVRRNVPAKAVTLLLDEWQKYASGLTGSMLAEARKFGMRLILANQNFAQLDPQLRESVLSNTGALACFRLGPIDAALVDGLFPTIAVHTLQTPPTPSP
jgi:type IV secretory pathway TraG/TraD family ATPase VirD4